MCSFAVGGEEGGEREGGGLVIVLGTKCVSVNFRSIHMDGLVTHTSSIPIQAVSTDSLW